MANADSANDRNGSILTALLRQPGTVWRLADPDGGNEELGSAAGAGRLLSRLQAHPALVLAGMKPGERMEVRWAEGGLQVRRSTMPGVTGGSDLRTEYRDPRVDWTILRRFLTAGTASGGLGEGRRRELAAAAFLSRLLDLLAGVEAPSILECAAGFAPYGLPLQACLARLGRQAGLVLLDEAGQAIENARLLAGHLGLTPEFLTRPISGYKPAAVPDLLLAVHACGQAMLEALALGLELSVPRLVLVPCCAPEGSWPAAGLLYGEAGADPCLRARLDAIGLILQAGRQFRLAGYETRTFEVYLRPWRREEIGLTAYLPPP